MHETYDVVICGAGIAGIATAYYLASQQNISKVLLVDRRSPMTLTSDKSGECYRNWWPHPAMVILMNRSIDLMDELAAATGNYFNLNRQGYIYVSKQDQSQQIAQIQKNPGGDIRVYNNIPEASNYQRLQPFDGGIVGADVFRNDALIAQHFRYLSKETHTVIHVRRAGWLSAQQLGMYLLQQAQSAGVTFMQATVKDIETDADGVSAVVIRDTSNVHRIQTRHFVNAAGPFANEIAAKMGVELPIHNVLHHKVVFQDVDGIIPRDAPMTIYLDGQSLDWTDEEREYLADDPQDHWLLEPFLGGLHLRPEGGEDSNWVKLGWAFNRNAESPTETPHLPETFPDIVVRGAVRVAPEMARYVNRIPGSIMYDGGFYTRTQENMPLIGNMGLKGASVIGALSGFGIMAACAVGELLSQHIAGSELPAYAASFDLTRYDDPAYLAEAQRYASGEL